MKLYVGNDNDVYVLGLRLASDDTAINDAVLTFTLYDRHGQVVAGTQQTTLSHVAGSDGDYRGVISGSTGVTGLTAGAKYRLVIESSNYNIRFEKWITATERSQ